MTQGSAILRLYRKPGYTAAKQKEIFYKLKEKCSDLINIDTEICFNIEVSEPLNEREAHMLKWLLQDPFHPENVFEKSQLTVQDLKILIEVGPRFNFSTSNSTNAVSICHSLGLKQVIRLEVSRRFILHTTEQVSYETENHLASMLHDRMTECRYTIKNIPKISFSEKLIKKEDIREIDVLTKGIEALKEIDRELGLAFDEADLLYYVNLFKNIMKRNPTNVECFDLAQSNSEHSRHWFFKGKMVIDNVEYEESLIDMIVNTQKTSSPNNVIKFADNSSAIKGYVHRSLRPVSSGSVSELKESTTESHLIFTAETHNFPTGVAPFSGATTGTGGRIRDVQSVGRGGYCIAGTAGYSVGNLHIPGYNFPWEDKSYIYPDNFAPPLEILIEASNGASDYGNKFGEPLICGFVRSFGLNDASGNRREWIKPIMFSGGIGSMEADMTEKLKPKVGHQIVKIGGPVYRIGVGGGSASSVEVQGDNKAELDFNAVQRGDAEMEQKLNRVVRACLELGDKNPIVSIHDQGAGGNGNVLKELVEPVGGIIYANRFELGDPTINILELWGAEYQENNALLCKEEDLELLKNICRRERCPINVVGTVTGTGRVVLATDESESQIPFNLELEHVLGKMPQKVYKLERSNILHKELEFPEALSIFQSLERVLRLPSVGSKRYLTNKVDRCVTGLIAQQQCVGPLHTPLADVAVTAISHFGYEGIASSIGEQPLKGLVNSAAGARMTVAEAISNLVFATVSDLRDVKCSGNWMWAAKLPGEGALLFDACKAMCDFMSELGIAIDGGKDSLSMAARVGTDTVKAPGTLVVSTYAPCPDVRKIVTPDFKAPSMGKTGCLIFVDLSHGDNRLGGSAIAQVFGQLGQESADVHCAEELANAFKATQELVKDGSILSGHDVSDGGVIVCLLEMCFAGMCGVDVNIQHRQGKPINILFSEEVGWVLEVLEHDVTHCINIFKQHNVPVFKIGKSIGYGMKSKVGITVNNACLETTVLPLMKMWEETSYKLELLQTIKSCAESEFSSLPIRTAPKYILSFDPDEEKNYKSELVSVAVIREEGTNGDREMAAAFVRAGFRVWDITMQDLLTGTVDLDNFQGVIFPGGFSYADVLGSAKGWAGSILFNEIIRQQFEKFYRRPDTFSLGVCNGCQLMASIGWIGTPVTGEMKPDISLKHNISERFECRWTTVKIEKSRAIMFKDMEGSSFGVWVAHGEGRFDFSSSKIYSQLKQENLVALSYVGDDGLPTDTYPMNPNGSIDGLAGLCSPDGRHLAMMPHPERCVQPFQWPYMPMSWKQYKNSPWEKMFRNAYDWCLRSQVPNVKIASSAAWEANLRLAKVGLIGTAHGARGLTPTNCAHLCDLPTDEITKKFSLEKLFRTELNTKREWNIESIRALGKNTSTWYTDGSKTPEGTGAGVFGPRTKYSEPMGQFPSIFQAEIHAIERCIQFNLDRKYRNQEIVILSDSQAAIKALSSCNINSKMVWECLDKLNDLGRNNKVTLLWVPGHVGVEGNEQADTLARKGAATPLIGPEPFCGLGKYYFREELNKAEEAMRATYWLRLPGLRQAKDLLGNFNRARSKTLINLSKISLKTITGFLTGHCRLKEHLRKLGLEEDSTCRFCGEHPETPHHILMECYAVHRKRLNILGSHQLTVGEIPRADPLKILKFLKELGLEGML